MEWIKTDVLVIGGGLAAVCAAIESRKYGVDVVLVDKGRIGSSGSSPTSGGSPQVLLPPEMGGHPEDSREVYFSDIVKGAEFLSAQEMVALLVDEAPQRTIEEERWGVPFRKKPDGKFETYITFGMSYPRVGPVERDGAGMMQALRKEALHRGVRPVENIMITKLIWNGQRVKGAIGVHVSSGNSYIFQAKCVVLAAGSALAMYPYSSANFRTTGDAYALAWDLNLPFMNMEFVEFTVIPAPNGIPFPTGGIKPTTGRGAKFYNRLGERFLAKYDPERLELTSRGKIVQAIYAELKAGNGPCYLDTSELTEPTMPLKKLEQAFGIDWRKERIPWVPAVHSFLGGVVINQKCATGVSGLYAAGEAAGHGGIFGADRVAGAIAACQVLGHRAGKYAAFEALETNVHDISTNKYVEQEEKRWHSINNLAGLNPHEIYKKLQQVCWKHVGILRNEKDLATGLNLIEEIDQTPVRINGVRELIAAMEVKNLALTAKLVITAALERKESRGEHQRVDYPEKNNREWLKWVLLQKQGDTISISKKSIPFECYPIQPH
ncbi:MAG: FAD-dependent oxidoreductase [Bacillota bacterium]